MKENYYALLICILRPDFTIDRSTEFMIDGRLRKNLPKGEGIDEMIRMKQQGMTHKEIGEMFGISKDAVHKRIQRYKEAILI
jgi:DNA invertase Pin-like site-specific DNA recombinase